MKSARKVSWLVTSRLLSLPPLQEYAQVTKMLGNGRLEAMCFDGVKRLCHIRGKLRKKVSESFALATVAAAILDRGVSSELALTDFPPPDCRCGSTRATSS